MHSQGHCQSETIVYLEACDLKLTGYLQNWHL